MIAFIITYACFGQSSYHMPILKALTLLFIQLSKTLQDECCLLPLLKMNSDELVFISEGSCRQTCKGVLLLKVIFISCSFADIEKKMMGF